MKKGMIQIYSGEGHGKSPAALGRAIQTGECALLILDEVLGLIDKDIITVEELKNLLAGKPEEMEIIMTGISLKDEVCLLADQVTRVETMHFKKFN